MINMDLKTTIKYGFERKYDKPVIFTITGNPYSGKTTAVRNLYSSLGIPQFKSYTTRPKRIRYEDEYYFVSEAEAYNIMAVSKVLAKTVYAGNIYFGLYEDLKPVQSYIIDPAGLEYLESHHAKDLNIIKTYIVRNTNEADDEIRMARNLTMGNVEYDYVITNENLEEFRISLYKIIFDAL